jgi:hypothetical protein
MINLTSKDWQSSKPLSDIINGMNNILKNSRSLYPNRIIMSYETYHKLLVFNRYSEYIDYLMNKSNFIMKFIIKFKTRKRY